MVSCMSPIRARTLSERHESGSRWVRFPSETQRLERAPTWGFPSIERLCAGLPVMSHLRCATNLNFYCILHEHFYSCRECHSSFRHTESNVASIDRIAPFIYDEVSSCHRRPFLASSSASTSSPSLRGHFLHCASVLPSVGHPSPLWSRSEPFSSSAAVSWTGASWVAEELAS